MAPPATAMEPVRRSSSTGEPIQECVDQRSMLVRNIPKAITCVTVLCGFMLMASASIPIQPHVCVMCTMLGLVADVLDGHAARILRVKSRFGATFDQLADLSCFGIGPAIFYTRQRLIALGSDAGPMSVFIATSSGYAYMVCSVYRIARELIVHEGARPLYFVGIPTNLACCFLVPFAASAPTSILLPPLVFALSAMMVMPISIPKGLWLFQVTETKVGCGDKGAHSE